jgi:hypothetical protein
MLDAISIYRNGKGNGEKGKGPDVTLELHSGEHHRLLHFSDPHGRYLMEELARHCLETYINDSFPF